MQQRNDRPAAVSYRHWKYHLLGLLSRLYPLRHWMMYIINSLRPRSRDALHLLRPLQVIVPRRGTITMYVRQIPRSHPYRQLFLQFSADCKSPSVRVGVEVVGMYAIMACVDLRRDGFSEHCSELCVCCGLVYESFVFWAICGLVKV